MPNHPAPKSQETKLMEDFIFVRAPEDLWKLLAQRNSQHCDSFGFGCFLGFLGGSVGVVPEYPSVV